MIRITRSTRQIFKSLDRGGGVIQIQEIETPSSKASAGWFGSEVLMDLMLTMGYINKKLTGTANALFRVGEVVTEVT